MLVAVSDGSAKCEEGDFLAEFEEGKLQVGSCDWDKWLVRVEGEEAWPSTRGPGNACDGRPSCSSDTLSPEARDMPGNFIDRKSYGQPFELQVLVSFGGI